ncbi:hypothetical protein LRP88_07367 [Fusarium phalaenopsidis]
MDGESVDELNRQRDMRNRENVALANLGIRTSADIFEAAERQLEEARSWKAPPQAGPADTSVLASLGIRASADMWEATQKQQEEAREKKSSRQQRGRKSRESGSVKRQPRSLEGRPGNNQPAGPGALFRSVQMDGGRRVPLAPRPSVGSLAGPGSEEEAHNQPNMATFAGQDFRPSAEMLEAGRRSLVAGLGLRTVADISEESRNENFRQRRRTRTLPILTCMLCYRCEHMFPEELKGLTPVEEKLIALNSCYGFITKYSIPEGHRQKVRYPRHVKGHITVFPNNVQELATRVLPHPILKVMDDIHVSWQGPEKPVPSDLSALLSVRRRVVEKALVWLKRHNPLYADIDIDTAELDSWEVPSHGVPYQVYERLERDEPSAWEKARTAQVYVTNYATKVEDPVWKRVAAAAELLPVLGEPVAESQTEEVKRGQSRTRQFLMRVANRIFTGRPLSQVEVVAHLLGYPTEFTSNHGWTFPNASSLYRHIFRRWRHLRRQSGMEMVEEQVEEMVLVEEAGQRTSFLQAYPHRGGLLLRGLSLYDYMSVVKLKRKSKGVGAWGEMQFDGPWPLSQTWVQALRRPGEHAVVCFDGCLSTDFSEEGEVYHMRMSFLADNIQLLRRSAEDAKRDAKRWAAQSGDADPTSGVIGPGMDDGDEGPGRAFQPGGVANAIRLIDVLRTTMGANQVTAGSKEISRMIRLLSRFHQVALRSMDEPCGHGSAVHCEPIGLGEQGVGLTRAESGVSARGAGPSTSIHFGPSTSLRQLAEAFTHNKRQSIALRLICRQIDRVRRDEQQFVGGEGGTGKSRVIEAVAELFASRGMSHRQLLTATSGAAAASIDGITIHSACGFSKDAAARSRRAGPDGFAASSSASLRIDGRTTAEWQEKRLLVVDEVDMLGARTLYAVNERLCQLRGSARDFGGIPAVLFCGDFHQFRPVQERSILLPSTTIAWDEERSFTAEQRYQHDRARALWNKFTTVVMLDEQVRAAGDPQLQQLLTRVRQGVQDQSDLESLNRTCYRKDRQIPWESGITVVTPLNRNRWNPNIEASLCFQKERRAPLRIFVSEHVWKDGEPSEEEAVMTLNQGDDSAIPVPAILMFVPGMPVVVNQNTHQGLKLVNGASYAALDVILDKAHPGYRVDANTVLHFGPPAGIVLASETTRDLHFVGMPPGTILLTPISIRIDCQRKRPWQKNDVSRRRLPCAPAFACTDYKVQSKTLARVALELRGTRTTSIDGQAVLTQCDPYSLYVQLSRCKSLDGIMFLSKARERDFIGNKVPDNMVAPEVRLERLSDATIREAEPWDWSG